MIKSLAKNILQSQLINLLGKEFEISSISDMYITNHDEHTRYVIMEKYPEKENGNSIINVNVEIKRPATYIKTSFQIEQID